MFRIGKWGMAFGVAALAIALLGAALVIDRPVQAGDKPDKTNNSGPAVAGLGL